MYDSSVFYSIADGLRESTDRLMNRTDSIGSQWKDSKYRELCSSMKELRNGEGNLRTAADACANSLAAFWDAASEQV